MYYCDHFTCTLSHTKFGVAYNIIINIYTCANVQLHVAQLTSDHGKLCLGFIHCKVAGDEVKAPVAQLNGIM